MNQIKRRLLLQMSIIFMYFVFFLLALNYENASKERMLYLVSFFSVIIICNILMVFIPAKKLNFMFIIIVEILFVFLLEYNSRFVVNYSIHIFYILIMIKAVIYLNVKAVFIPGILSIVVSMIKYMLWIRIESNYQNISQTVMFFLLSIFLFTLCVFLKTYNQEKHKIKELYDTLIVTNNQLKEQINKVEKLAKTAERTSVARELHDSLGHELTGLIVQSEMAYQLSKKENTTKDFKNFIMNISDSARKCLKSVREIVETLREDNIDTFYKNSISELIENFKDKTGVSINYKEINKGFVLTPLQNAVIYRTVQEAMTNAVRHGKAECIDILLKVTEKNIKLTIKDNGIGSTGYVEGYGLKGMKERIHSLNGTIEISSSSGFDIIINIPMEDFKID